MTFKVPPILGVWAAGVVLGGAIEVVGLGVVVIAGGEVAAWEVVG